MKQGRYAFDAAWVTGQDRKVRAIHHLMGESEVKYVCHGHNLAACLRHTTGGAQANEMPEVKPTGTFWGVTITPIEEVHRLHRFIEAWMSGQEVPEDSWSEFARSLAPTFEMVVPTGTARDRNQVLEGFGQARGAAQGVTVEIRAAVELYRSDGLAVVRYEEWQLHPSQSNQRVSTVVLGEHGEIPGRWWWLALHETSIEIDT